jgi:hypothetical protein
MSDSKFTYGNIIILYSNHIKGNGTVVPDYINERIKTCLNVFQRIQNSKPDSNYTSIVIVADKVGGEMIKNCILASKEDLQIRIDSKSKNLLDSLKNVVKGFKDLPNPPFIYVVSSFWHKEIFDLIKPRLKGLKIQFDGSLDHRPVDEISFEKKKEHPSIGVEGLKNKAKNRALNSLLNYIFPDK